MQCQNRQCFEKRYNQLSVCLLADGAIPEDVLPRVKIVRHSDVTYTIPPHTPWGERFTSVCLAIVVSQITGVPDYQPGTRQRNGFANRASFG
jgi:hypothetical protein